MLSNTTHCASLQKALTHGRHISVAFGTCRSSVAPTASELRSSLNEPSALIPTFERRTRTWVLAYDEAGAVHTMRPLDETIALVRTAALKGRSNPCK